MNRSPISARLLFALAAATIGAGAFSQEAAARPYRSPIHHADPWVVKALIEGLPVSTPEASTIPGFGGFLARGAGAANGLLKAGYLVVNPTDNSLWYYPRH